MSVSSVPLPPVAAPDPAKSASETAVGCLLVAGSAIAWSTGGALTRFLEIPQLCNAPMHQMHTDNLSAFLK